MKGAVHIRREVRSSAAAAALTRAARAALRQAGVSGELTIVLTDNRRMRRLNARFAGVDHATDVLAFQAGDTDGDPGYLGDVVIALPQARLQAKRLRIPLTQELALLVVHGSLHLAGHDHRREGERRRMWRTQAEALRRLELDPERLGVAP